MATSQEPLKVLIVDDDQLWRETISRGFRILGHEPEYAGDFEEAIAKIDAARGEGIPFSVATIDMRFEIGSQSDTSANRLGISYGNQILQYIKKRYPGMACIMISGSGVTPEMVLDLRDEYDLDYFIQKDRFFEPKMLERAVARALERAQETTETQPGAVDQLNQPEVFVSYRRSVSWGQARAVANSLRERGVDVFLDLDGIREGEFAPRIEKEIKEREYFMPILAPTTLESEWVMVEINQALVLGKTIIPLLVDGFRFDQAQIPAHLRRLADMNAVELRPEFYDAGIERLVNHFLSRR
jgi:CheY-like chemotaxis protein